MRTAFIAGVLLGIAAVIAAARYVPWVDPERLPSQTSVVANGGRAESFVIRLPADRIAAQGSAESGLRGAPFPADAALPDALASAPLLVEQFKVRDREDNVIGVAARHWTETDGEPAAAWLIVIPSRGTLRLMSAAEPARAVDARLASAGARQGEAWSGDVTLDASSGQDGGKVLGGSDEFEGLEGRYTETWTLTGAGESGELKGTIELRTVTYGRT